MKTQSVLASSRVQEIINAWDLSRIKTRMLTEGYSQEQLDAMEVEYKRYLYITFKYADGGYPISAPLDDMWHTHIIFTKDYAAFGQAIGRFIHHTPSRDAEQRKKLAGRYIQFLAIYRRHFGTPSPIWWPPKSQVCKCCCE